MADRWQGGPIAYLEIPTGTVHQASITRSPAITSRIGHTRDCAQALGCAGRVEQDASHLAGAVASTVGISIISGIQAGHT